MSTTPTLSNDASEMLRFTIRRKARVVARMLIGTIAAVMLLCVIDLIVSPRVALVVQVVAVVVVTVVTLLLLTWMERRMVRANVVASPAALYVYNGIVTHVVPWSDVAGFEPSSKPFLMAVTRTNGRPITMAGITPESFGKREAQRAQMRELEAYWRRATAGGS